MGWMHQFEFDYLKNNHKKIHDVLDELSFLPDKCDGVIGGLMFALSLDDEKKIKMASMWGKDMIIQANERLPHLEYLKSDFYSRKMLNISESYLDSLIGMTKEVSKRDTKKFINAKTFVDMKIKEFIDKAIAEGITKPAKHLKVIYHLFKKFNYEKRYGHENNIDSIYHQKNAIEKRYYRILDKEYTPTVFNIEKIPTKV